MRLRHNFACLVLLSLGWLPVFAQDQAAAPDQPAPIVRAAPRAARLTFFVGSVQIERADNTGDDTPLLNMPLTEGTRIVTGDYGQAEIEFEDGSVARVTPRSALTLQVLSLDAQNAAHTTLTLLGGLAYFELRKLPDVTYTVQAAGLQATPSENLILRVNIDEPPVSFAVISGAAQIQALDSTQTSYPVVRAGETLRPDAQDTSRYFLASTLAPENWDQWNQSRDLEAANQADTRTSARDGFAGSQGYGWSDLDASGTWYNVPGQGNVWQPADAASATGNPADFDPYANGAWVWSGSGGYAFASAYAWGWTPYRCGRWAFYAGFGWGWSPNSNCGLWGFAGGAGSDLFIYSGAGGGRRIPIPRPVLGPHGSHPVLPVHPPARTNPPIPIRRQVSIAGIAATPLAPVGPPLARHPGVSGQALEHDSARDFTRDFPVDRNTHQPILGVTTAPSIPARLPAVPRQSAAPGRPAAAVPSTVTGTRPADTGTRSQRTFERNLPLQPYNVPTPARNAPAPSTPRPASPPPLPAPAPRSMPAPAPNRPPPPPAPAAPPPPAPGHTAAPASRPR